VPLQRTPLLSIALILALPVVYALTVLHGGSFWSGLSAKTALDYGVIPAAPRFGDFLRSLFLHGSFPALLVDVLALGVFGLGVEDALGRVRFLVLYLLGGGLALGLRLLVVPNSPAPAFGAVAAVAAVLSAYLILRPRARVVSLVPLPFFATIVEVPAVLYLALWLGLQVWFALGGIDAPLAYDRSAALGSLAFGALTGALLARPTLLAPSRAHA
jgi:membrane associated rhomboid family serine protease